MRLGRDSHSFRERLAVVMPGSTELLTRCRDFRNGWKKHGPGSLCPRHWNAARLCRRPAAARGKFEASGACSVLRLVEDDTVALRSNSAEVERAKRQKMPDRIRTPAKFNRSTPTRSLVRTRIRCEW